MKNKSSYIPALSLVLLFWALCAVWFYLKEHSVYLLFFEVRKTSLLEIFFVIYLGLIAYFSGAALSRIICQKSQDDDFCGRFVSNTLLGFGVIAVLTFLLGIFGLYQSWILLILHFILLIFSAGEIKRLLDFAQGNDFRLDAEIKISPIQIFWFIIFLIMATMRLCGALTPPYGDDSQWYHLGIPLDYISAGCFYPIRNNPAAAFPANYEMINLHCLSLSTDIAASVFNFFTGILLFISVYVFAKKFISQKLALMLAVILYSDPTIQFLNVEIKNDQFLALAILLSIYHLFEFLRTKETRFLYLVGVFWGIALGTKYTAINIMPFLFIATPALVWSEIAEKRAKKIAIIFLMCFAFCGIWYVKNIILYQNPIAPFYNKVFFWKNKKIAAPAELSTVKDVSASAASVKKPGSVDLTRFYGMGRSAKDYFMLPYNITIRGARGTSRFDSTITPFFLALLPFALFLLKDKKIRYLFILLIGQFIAWALQESQNARYLVLGFPIAIILIGFGIEGLASKKIKSAIFALCGVVAFLFAFTEFLLFVHNDAQPYKFVFHLENRDTYLTRAAGPLYEGSVFLKKQWQENKKIKAFYIGTRSNYFFREGSVADYNLRRILEINTYGETPEGMREYLKIHKVNRILVEYKMLAFFYSRSEERKKDLAKFIEFRDKYLKQIFFKEGLSQVVGIYELTE